MSPEDRRNILRRLNGEPHQHHPHCIHNLTPEEQIARRGRTVEWWQAMGLPMPEQVTPADWVPFPEDGAR